MQRYEIGRIVAFWAGSHKSSMIKSSCGDYVLHSDAQAEIARLTAEVDRLKGFIRHIAKAGGDAGERALICVWNDAIEAAATAMIGLKVDDDEFDRGGYWFNEGITDSIEAILSLKRPTS